MNNSDSTLSPNSANLVNLVNSINSVLSVRSPAKINLFLHVHQPREDGFHDLKTYFQLIDLCDTLHFSLNDDGEIRVDNPSIAVPLEQDLCYRAAKALQDYTQTQQGVSISVDKQIPDGGGLGGGSSNAATVLLVLNRLWQLGLSECELLQIGLDLGSDVPIFVYGQSTYAEGRGEIFDPNRMRGLSKNQCLVIVKPDVHVSTAEIFQSPLLTKRNDTGKIRDLDTVCCQNDFTTAVFTRYPEIFLAAERLSAFATAHLTGTGACLYAVLDDVKKADKISRALGSDYQVFSVKALSRSPLEAFK